MNKKRSHKPGKVNKGAPSGFVISLIFHGVAFFVAGIFVVFTVLPKPKPVFEAPPVAERPKMSLKKPKVKIKKSSSPKPSSRIVANVKMAKMPEISIPDLVGTGEGLMGGMGGVGGDGFGMPGEGTVTNPFGTDFSTGNDLVGTFYDFKRRATGSQSSVDADPSLVPNDLDVIIHKFMKGGWKRSSLSQYYHSPRKLYSPCVCIGTVHSTLAPLAYGEDNTDGYAWAVLYQGKLVYHEDIKFRFRGVGDKFMGVRVDGKVVLLCVYNESVREYFSDIWTSRDGDSRVYPMGEDKQEVGDWIELKAGVPLDIEIIMGDRHGGLIYHQLCVEVDGVEYEQNPFGGGPCLPVFKTDNLSRAQIDAIYLDTYSGDLCLTNGPVFTDHPVPAPSYEAEIIENVPMLTAKEASTCDRQWTLADGRVVDARMVSNMGKYVILENAAKQRTKLQMEQLSEEDRRFAEMGVPPEFRIKFSHLTDQIPVTHLGPYDAERDLKIFDYNFGAKIEKYSPGEYNHKLFIEYFAIGGEIIGDNYVLLERKTSAYTPTKENKYTHEFYGDPVRLREYSNRDTWPVRGMDYDGYLIVVTDEDGHLVQYETSNEFLFRNLTRLKALPIWAHFDKDCIRTFPARPIERGGQSLDF